MAAVVVGLTAWSAVGCSDSDDAPSAAVSTTSTVADRPPASSASTTTTVGDVLGDGEHVGYITDLQELDDGSYGLGFDLAYLLTGREATEAAEEAGVELDTDYYIQNDNPREREVVLAPTVVTSIVGEGEACCDSVEVPLEEFEARIRPTIDASSEVRAGPLVRLTIDQGQVTRIDEVYLS